MNTIKLNMNRMYGRLRPWQQGINDWRKGFTDKAPDYTPRHGSAETAEGTLGYVGLHRIGIAPGTDAQRPAGYLADLVNYLPPEH